MITLANGGSTLVSSVSYFAHGGVDALAMGNGLTEQTCYNTRLQPTIRRLGTGTQTGCANASDKLHLTFDWGAAGSNNGNLKGQTIAAPGFSQTQYYEYDATNRLKIAVEGAPVPGSLTCPATSSWCREYSYDHFGNRWVSSNRTMHMAVPTSQSAFNAANNWLTAAGDDAAGNMTSHPWITPGGSMAYNANNLMTSCTATGENRDGLESMFSRGLTFGDHA